MEGLGLSNLSQIVNLKVNSRCLTFNLRVQSCQHLDHDLDKLIEEEEAEKHEESEESCDCCSNQFLVVFCCGLSGLAHEPSSTIIPGLNLRSDG